MPPRVQSSQNFGTERSIQMDSDGLRYCHECSGQECIDNDFDRMGHCTVPSDHKCFSSATLINHDGEEFTLYKRGCARNAFVFDFAQNNPELNKFTKIHFCEEDYCNNGTFPELVPKSSFTANPSASVSALTIFLYLLGSLVFIILAFVFFIFIFKKYSKKKINKNEHSLRAYGENETHMEREFLNSDYRPEIKVTAPGDSTLREVLIDGSVTSGSGSGFPMLIQRTLGKQIHLKQCIGKGRYGEVWKGDLHYDEVAVKIFYSKDEASFNREVEIYSTIILKNENILPFIGSDIISMSSSTQLWLVTTYYPLGSLFDFLNENTLTVQAMLNIMISIVSGLDHLHTGVKAIEGKPAIAHRDIKSKNILMKSPDTCCIADFGLAVTHKQTTQVVNISVNYRVGTKRYMAPEVLDGTLKETDFESFTKADIYSLSLVLWEIICRTESKLNAALPYKVPYQGMVPNDPSFDDMRNVVCTQNLRPEISSHFEGNPQLAVVINLIKETWSRAPNSRLVALRIKKDLAKIREDKHLN